MRLTFVKICFLFFVGYPVLAYSQDIKTLDGLAYIPVDIYRSKQSNSPTVVYAHGCSGYDAFDVQKARLIRSWGYNVVVAEYTRGRGLANQTASNGRNITCVQGYKAYPMQQRADDLIAIGNWISQQEWHSGKIAAIGFSLGGGAVEYLINTTDKDNPFSAGISFYPYCRLNLLPDRKTLPNQFHIGTLDEGYNRCLKLNQQENRHNIYIYEGATHAFDNNWGNSNRNGFVYDSNATKLSFDRVREFLDQHLNR